MDRELLREHSEGLIALSGCRTGELQDRLLDAAADEAPGGGALVPGDLRRLLPRAAGPRHARARRGQPRLVEMSRETGIPLVATNDVHYVHQADAATQDILLCIGTNSSVLDEKRMRMPDDSYYLKSEEEMRDLFPETPEAIDNTRPIAEMCDLDLRVRRPAPAARPTCRPGKSADDYLAELCYGGLARALSRRTRTTRGAASTTSSTSSSETGFANYILVVRDFADFARGRGIAMGVRGSAAASIVLYCLGITDIDPLANRLVFERFLNIERREMPDIDIDFADDRRDEVIRYVAENYGGDHVAQIITFGTLGAKAAIRDVGRALGMTYAEVDRVARLVPNALHMTIERALSESAEMQQRLRARRPGAAPGRHGAAAGGRRPPRQHPRRRRRHLPRPAGRARAAAAAAQRPRGERQRRRSAIPMTQFAMEQVAKIGLLKMDFLGLVNLTILEQAVEHHPRDARASSSTSMRLPDGDPKTFEMLAQGRDVRRLPAGESAGMRRYIQELQPTIDRRPGGDGRPLPPRPDAAHPDATSTRSTAGSRSRYPHPDLADILDETYGVIVYQDQVLLIAQKFAGYTLGEADIMRKAMGKKIATVMQAEQERFIAGAGERGYSEADAQPGLRPDRAVRRLRLQQGARRLLRHHRLPDRLPEGELSRPST